MAADNRTEQPTPRRRQKAREQGQVARSRELPAALAVCATLAILAWMSQNTLVSWHDLLRVSLAAGLSHDLRHETLMYALAVRVLATAALLPLSGACAIALLAGVAQGGIVFAPTAMAPKLERLSPAAKLKQLFSLTALSAIGKSLIPFAVIAYFTTVILARDWSQICAAAATSQGAVAQFLGDRLLQIAWRSAFVLLLWGGVDYWLVRRKLEGDLRMSREEIREESKESEGNPQIKARIRRLQRQVSRRRMMQDVATASVVVTNPTHFAVALLYKPDMAAPTVVAKGQNLMAQRIKEAARWHNVPILENKPLAQALYRTVEIGQAIPGQLYAAVAELLAFVYRAQQQAARAGVQ